MYITWEIPLSPWFYFLPSSHLPPPPLPPLFSFARFFLSTSSILARRWSFSDYYPPPEFSIPLESRFYPPFGWLRRGKEGKEKALEVV